MAKAMHDTRGFSIAAAASPPTGGGTIQVWHSDFPESNKDTSLKMLASVIATAMVAVIVYYLMRL